MTRTRDRAILLALVLLSAAAGARGGEPRVATPGNRVRLEFREPVRKKLLFIIPYTKRETRRVAGELVMVTADSVTILQDRERGLLSLPLGELESLSVSTGTRRHLPGGLAGGFIFGAVIATPIAAAEDESGERTYDAGTSAAVVIGSTILGGILGWLDVSDRWEKAEPVKPALTAARRGDGFGIGVVCRF